jgi:hypothetical protein
MLSARKQLDVINAYRRVGTYRGAAEICGVTHKTVERVVEKDQTQAERVERRKNYESVRDLVADELRETKGKISAKRVRLCRVRPQLFAASCRRSAPSTAAAKRSWPVAPGGLGAG